MEFSPALRPDKPVQRQEQANGTIWRLPARLEMVGGRRLTSSLSDTLRFSPARCPVVSDLRQERKTDTICGLAPCIRFRVVGLGLPEVNLIHEFVFLY